MDPVATPAAVTAAGKWLAEQGFQAGKARMRSEPPVVDRKAAYIRFQDAAVANMSTMMLIASRYQGGHTTVPESLMLRLETNVSLLAQATRGLHMVASQDVVVAADGILVAIGRFRPKLGEDGVLDKTTGIDSALNEFTRAVRVELRYDLPYRNRWWQFRRPVRPEAAG